MCVHCHGNPRRVSNVPHGPSAKFQVENGKCWHVVICQKWGSGTALVLILSVCDVAVMLMYMPL